MPNISRTEQPSDKRPVLCYFAENGNRHREPAAVTLETQDAVADLCESCIRRAFALLACPPCQHPEGCACADALQLQSNLEGM